ncbi:hypothetical protein [Streptomyces sp. NPDC059909]|uniref:hypothetical protein n=1 Tax=Streptomyces sp. NPDC059909 TaxID=3346998 RepID=UPI003656E89C
MKKLMSRIALAAAAATVAGSALVAVGTPASAMERSDQSLTRTTDSRFEHRLAEISEGWSLWDGRRDWHGERDHQGHSYWRSGDNSRQLRYDGHRVYHWTDGQWAAVAPADEYEYGFDRWHFDQLWSIYSVENRRSI